MRKIIGLFGGTFDPVHKGHIGIIQQVDSLIELSEIRWILSARPPHKNEVSASIEHRLEMLNLAIGDIPHWKVDESEIRRSKKSYTYDTLLELKEAEPDVDFLMIIGEDSLNNLSSWYRYPQILDLANWLVVSRPGVKASLQAELKSRITNELSTFLETSSGAIYLYQECDFDISSTSIRKALIQKQSQTEPPDTIQSAVYHYIQEHHLYKIQSMTPEQIKDEIVEAVDDLKGQDIKTIDIAEISDFADFMVVVSGTSDVHVKAIAREASDRLRKQGYKPLNEDGADIGEWVLVDFGDVVLHVMRPEVREYYDLEKLWDEDVRAMVKQHREQMEE